MDKSCLQAGVNLGGWLSQYPAYDYRHFDTFITKDDIRRIAGWGFDHVRLPVDHPVLEDSEHPGTYIESGFDYIRKAIAWCKENGLRVVLDLHKAPGFSFDAHEESTLFSDPHQQERFVALWGAIAQRLPGDQDIVAFELLNEIVLPDSAPWNRLARAALLRVRQVDPERLVVIGANHYSVPGQLQYLEVLPDPNVLYTFHSYEPMVVTHQKAYWVPWLKEFDLAADYPASLPEPERLLKIRPDMRDYIEVYTKRAMDIDLLREIIRPAADFARKTGQAVYCGEFGVIEQAPMSARLNWTRDFVAALGEHGIGRARWSYKAMDFGLVDGNGRVVNEELVRIASAH